MNKDTDLFEGLPEGRKPDQGFDEFWAEYPRVIDKRGAQHAYIRAIKRGHTPAEIIMGLRAYRFETNSQFIPMPRTWLNQDRFVLEVVRPAQSTVVPLTKPSRSSWRDKYDGGPGVNSPPWGRSMR